jgi:hypothetical protein
MIGGLPSIQTIAAGVAVSSLGALLFAGLQSQGCARAPSLIATALAVVQPAFLEPALSLKAALLALTTYAISVNAIALSGSRDARRIIQLGGSFAGAQVLSPLAGTLVSALLPLTFDGLQWRKGLAHAAGFYLLLLFIPALTALALLFLWRTHPDLSLFANGFAANAPATMRSPLQPLLAAIPITPGLLCAAIVVHQPRACEITTALAAVAIASAMLANWFGVRQHPVELIAALSPVSIAAFRSDPIDPVRRAAIQFSAASMCLLSWGVSFACAALS